MAICFQTNSELVSLSTSNIRLTPKSQILMDPSPLMRRFSGLMSPWNTFWETNCILCELKLEFIHAGHRKDYKIVDENK